MENAAASQQTHAAALRRPSIERLASRNGKVLEAEPVATEDIQHPRRSAGVNDGRSPFADHRHVQQPIETQGKRLARSRIIDARRDMHRRVVLQPRKRPAKRAQRLARILSGVVVRPRRRDIPVLGRRRLRFLTRRVTVSVLRPHFLAAVLVLDGSATLHRIADEDAFRRRRLRVLVDNRFADVLEKGAPVEIRRREPAPALVLESDAGSGLLAIPGRRDAVVAEQAVAKRHDIVIIEPAAHRVDYSATERKILVGQRTAFAAVADELGAVERDLIRPRERHARAKRSPPVVFAHRVLGNATADEPNVLARENRDAGPVDVHVRAGELPRRVPADRAVREGNRTRVRQRDAARLLPSDIRVMGDGRPRHRQIGKTDRVGL